MPSVADLVDEYALWRFAGSNVKSVSQKMLLGSFQLSSQVIPSFPFLLEFSSQLLCSVHFASAIITST